MNGKAEFNPANVPVYLGFRFMYLSRSSDSEVIGLIFPVDILNENMARPMT